MRAKRAVLSRGEAEPSQSGSRVSEANRVASAASYAASAASRDQTAVRRTAKPSARFPKAERSGRLDRRRA
jgi:hypothetical protein